MLIENTRYEWKATPLVRGEVRNAECRMSLERAIIEGRVQVVEIDTSSERETVLWAEWSERLDAGEAESVALAIARGWHVALEDRKGQRAIDGAMGERKWINCANVLLDAIGDGRLSQGEADDVFSMLSCFSGYQRKGVTSLKDLERRA